MSASKKISIVTPTYNQGQYIEQTILSVLEQGYSNMEYIIIDGGSTDNTIEIIKKYEKYLAYWVSERDRGQSHAINKGLQKCTGEIFNWINSDDYFEMGIFEKIARHFENNAIVMVGGKSRVFGGEKEWVSEGTKLPVSNEKIIHPSIDQPATFFRMDAVKKFGPLTEGLHYTMDLEWLLKFWFMYGNNAMLKISDIVAHFREHPGSKTVNFQTKFAAERVKIYQSILYQLGLSQKQPIDYTFDMPKHNCVPVEIIQQSFYRYINWQMQENYAQKKYGTFLELYANIQPDVLPEADRIIVKKQAKRAKLLKLIYSK